MGKFSAKELLERRQGVGASELPILFGLGYADQSPLQLYFEKRGEIDRSFEESEAQYWGTVMEEPIADTWAERNKMKIRRQPAMRWAKDKETNPLFASIDRQIISHPRGPGVLEVKHFSEWHGRKIDTLEDIPPAVRIQAMGQLAVFDYQWGAIAILVGGHKLLSFEFERDQEAIDEILQAVRVFMQQVKEGKPPAVDYKSGSVLADAYAKAGGATITCVDPTIDRIARELVHWKAQENAADAEWELRKNALKLLMANAETLILPGFGEITWKKTKDKTERVFNEEQFKRDDPATYEKYVLTVPKLGYRVFKDKPDKEDSA